MQIDCGAMFHLGKFHIQSLPHLVKLPVLCGKLLEDGSQAVRKARLRKQPWKQLFFLVGMVGGAGNLEIAAYPCGGLACLGIGTGMFQMVCESLQGLAMVQDTVVTGAEKA